MPRLILEFTFLFHKDKNENFYVYVRFFSTKASRYTTASVLGFSVPEFKNWLCRVELGTHKVKS